MIKNMTDFCTIQVTVSHHCVLPPVCSWQLLGVRPEIRAHTKISFGLLLPVGALGCAFGLFLLYFRVFSDTFNMCSCSLAKLSTAPWTRARLHRLAFPPTTNLCWVSTIHGMTSHCERPVHCARLHA